MAMVPVGPFSCTLWSMPLNVTYAKSLSRSSEMLPGQLSGPKSRGVPTTGGASLEFDLRSIRYSTPPLL